MQVSINANWVEGFYFEADVNGFKIPMDSDPEHGGQGRGTKPKPLMMVALAGCTGMDVVSLMNKMRVNFKSFNVIVEGETSEEHPKRFTGMKIIYEFRGKGIDQEKVEKAVNLSQNKYCGVSASYRKAMDLDYEIRILEED